MRSGPLSFIAKAMDATSVALLTVRFVYDATSHLIVWVDEMVIEDMVFSIGMIISKDRSGTKFFWLLKFDVPEVMKLPKTFGNQRGLFEDVINTGRCSPA